MVLLDSVDPNALISTKSICQQFPKNQKARLRPHVSFILTALRQRGLLVKLDKTPRYRLLNAGRIRFHNMDEVMAIDVLPEERQKGLELLCLLGRVALTTPEFSERALFAGFHQRNGPNAYF